MLSIAVRTSDLTKEKFAIGTNLDCYVTKIEGNKHKELLQKTKAKLGFREMCADDAE